MSYSKYDLNSKITSIQASTGIVNSKISSLQVPPTPNVLSVVDTITVDSGPTGFTQIVGGSVGLSSPASTTFNLMTQDNITITGLGGENSVLSKDNLVISGNTFPTIKTTLNNSSLILTDGTTTNTLDTYSWTGNIQTVNTVANLTHYLNFSDSSATGYGKPQKNATLSCNPSTGLLTATTFSGSLTGNASSASSISLTSDNTAGTYYLPFSKTVASNSTLYVDNVTGPLTYNPSTSTLTAIIFSGSLNGTASSASSITLTSDNTNGAYFIPFSKTTAGSGLPLFVDDAISPFTYNPSTGVLTATSLAGTATSALTVNTVSDNTSGTYYIPFSKTTAGVSTNLYLDDTSGTLTYNPSLSALTCGAFVGDLQYTSTANSITSFTTNILTISCGTFSIRNFNWTLTGTTNNLVGITTTGIRNNGVYTIMILNNGSGAFTINTALTGSNIKTKYTSVVTVPAGGLAVMTMQILTIGGTVYQVVDAYNIA